MIRANPSTKRNVAAALLLALIAAIAIVGATSGLGSPSVPEGDVAIVDEVEDGAVDREDYQRALEQSAARLGLEEVPAETDPQFQQLQDETMQGLLLAIWAEGEAAERGIEVSEEDVQAELDQISESFNSEREFARVVEDSKFCTEEEIAADTPPLECEDVQEQGRLLALQRQLAEVFTPDEPQISDEELRDFYEENIESFQTPASRDVRVILNEDEAVVEEARAELEGVTPDSEGFEAAWRAAAKEYSQDQASKDRGGLLEGLVEGQGDPQLDEQVFSAGVGELVGPFETGRGFYLIQVVDTAEAATQSFDEVSPGISQQLIAARQQAEQTERQNQFIEKWTARTFCIDEVLMQFCSGFTPPDPEQLPGQPPVPEPPAVQSTSPIEPGTATLSIDGSTTTGLPQGPITALPEEQAPAGLPEDAIPIGPDGAPAPGGAPPAP